jgi:hypothetical protein
MKMLISNHVCGWVWWWGVVVCCLWVGVGRGRGGAVPMIVLMVSAGESIGVFVQVCMFVAERSNIQTHQSKKK